MHVLIALDYEALGEHMWADTGIFDFFRALPLEAANIRSWSSSLPRKLWPGCRYRGPFRWADYSTISWADQERDTSAWLGNEMQWFCYEELRRMEPEIKGSGSPELLDCWRRMLTSDHLYYMATKSFSDQDVHKYFSAYGSVFEAFVRLQTAIMDVRFLARNVQERT